MPYHPTMAPPPFVVAVVGSVEPYTQEVHTAAWVVGRDVAWAGAWLAVNVGGMVAASASAGARGHEGVVLGFTDVERDGVTADEANASLVFRTGLARPQLATILAANADALIALPGHAETMGEVAAALQLGVPVAQVGTTDWPARSLTPTEVPAWLEHIRGAASAAPPNPPDPPVLDPQTDTPASGSEAPANTPSSLSTAGDVTSSPSPTTPTNEPASTSSTPTG
jgi:hypothetical protein